MGKWGPVRNVRTVVRSDNDNFDENKVPRGLERPRRDNGRPAEPRPDGPALSSPCLQGSYKSQYLSSYPQGLPPLQHSQSQYGGGSGGQNHSAPQAMGANSSQPSTYSSGYGNNQGHYPPPAQNQPTCNTGSQHSMSGQGYSSQQPASGGHYQQAPHGSQGQSGNQNTYPQQTSASSYGQDCYSQTSASQQQSQRAAPPGLGSPYNPHDPSYNGGYPSRTNTAPAAPICEHGRPKDGS